MLTIQIEDGQNANGYLLDALVAAEKCINPTGAEAMLRAVLHHSCIYRVTRETPETVAVTHVFKGRVVARVGAE